MAMMSTMASGLSVSLPDLLTEARPQTVLSLTEGFRGFNRHSALKPPIERGGGRDRGSASSHSSVTRGGHDPSDWQNRHAVDRASSELVRVLPVYYRVRHMVLTTEKSGHRVPERLQTELKTTEAEACAHLRPLNWQLFQRFDDRQLARLLRLMPFLRLAEGRWVFGNEESGEWPKGSNRVFILLSGEVQLFRQPPPSQNNVTVFAGTVFGEKRIRIGDETIRDELGVAARCEKPCTVGMLSKELLRNAFADRTVGDHRMAKVLQKLPALQPALGTVDSDGKKTCPAFMFQGLNELARLGSNVNIVGGMKVLSEEPLAESFLVVQTGVLEVRTTMTLEERLETRPPKKVRVRVTVLRGEDLAGDSIFDRLDPYCIVQVGPFKRFQTPTLNNAGTKPKWNHTGVLKYTDEPEINFSVYDYDKHSADDLVGNGTLTLHEFENGYEGPVQLMQSKRGIFKSEACQLVPGGKIFVKVAFDLEYPSMANSIAKRMVFPDELLFELTQGSMWGHEHLMLGEKFREVLEQASQGLRYALKLGGFTIKCQAQKGISTQARCLKVSKKRFHEFLQHTSRDTAMRALAVQSSIDKQQLVKERLFKLIRKWEREEQTRLLQGRASAEEEENKPMDPSIFRSAYRGTKCKIVVRNALNLASGGGLFTFDKLDPYAVVQFRGSKKPPLKTFPIQDAGADPIWDYEGELEYNGEQVIDVEVWDYDKGSNDDLCGKGTIGIQEFCNNYEGMVMLTKPEEKDGKKKTKNKKPAGIVLSLQFDRPANMDTSLIPE